MEQTPEPAPTQPDAAPPEPAPQSGGPPPAARIRTPGRPRGIVIALVLVALLVLAIVAYATAGFVSASTRISSADRALDTVISHQNQLNATFRSIDAQAATLKSGSNFNVTQAQNLINQFVSSSEAAGKTIAEDDSLLAAASAGLSDQRWLTAFSRGSLDRESNRIRHARKALGKARIVAGDYVQDGRFWQALYKALGDLDQLSTENSSGDVTGAKATVAGMKSDVGSALSLSVAPGLPPELHDLMIDFQTLATDFGKLLDAVTAQDDTQIIKAEQVVEADATKISGYDFDKISTEIDNYYKPLVDGFNSELAAATA